MQEFEIIQDTKSTSLKEYLLGPLAERGFALGQVAWTFIEETAVGVVLGKKNRVFYSFFETGLKLSTFSADKLNQILVFSYTKEGEESVKKAYYRACRRFKQKYWRVQFFALTQLEQLKEKTVKLLEVLPYEKELKERLFFSFLVQEKEKQESFYQVCLEYGITNLQTLLVFPQNFLEISGPLDQESVLFNGEIKKDKVSYFLQSMKEENLNLNQIFFSYGQKIES